MLHGCCKSDCEHLVNRNGDPNPDGPFCRHPAEAVNREDGCYICPFHKLAIPIEQYEKEQEEREKEAKRAWYEDEADTYFA